VSNLLPFPAPGRVREEAATWLARLDRGLSQVERRELVNWVRDPSQRQVLEEMGRQWHDLDVLCVLAELFPRTSSATVATPAPAHAIRVRWTATAVVAGLAALVLGVLLAHPGMMGDLLRRSGYSSVHETYATRLGQRKTVYPGDGSTVTLNTQTRLSLNFSRSEREVFLAQGEASFAVAHDAHRPFDVHAGNRIFRAVGTAFNVRVISPDDVELTVTQGRVRVLTDPPAGEPGPQAAAPDLSRDTTVSASEMAVMEPKFEAVRTLSRADIEARLAWQRGMLIFRGEPLERVLVEVNRYSNIRFVLADDSLRSVRVGGYFRAGDIDGLLIALRQNFQIQSRRDGENEIVLSAAGTP